jgi:hypothetical protein
MLLLNILSRGFISFHIYNFDSIGTFQLEEEDAENMFSPAAGSILRTS